MILLQEESDQIKKEEENSNSSQPDLDNETISLKPSIAKEDFTVVKGIGPHLAEILNKAGFTSLKTIIDSTPETLANIRGVGQATARKIIEASKQFLRIKNLNNFSQVRKESKKENKNNTLSYCDKNDEDLLLSANYSNEKPWFEENFNSSRLKGPTNRPKQVKKENTDITESDDSEFDFKNENEESEDLLRENIQDITDINNEAVDSPLRLVPNEAVISPEMMRESEFSLQEMESSSKETLSQGQLAQISKDVIKKLEVAQFDVVTKLPELRAIFTGVDIIAIRHVQVKEFVDFIYLIPVKISSLKGTLVLSHDAVQYMPIESTENAYRMGQVASSYLKVLSKTEKAIASNMTNGGYLLPYLSKYVGHSISLEKSITGKNLFFRSGPLQYKIFVEPILVCPNKVGFIEKIIPFAYHKASNIHAIEQSKLSDLLQFLDQKYFLIETYTEEENALVLDNNATTKFISDLRKYSAPFMLYGIVVLLVLLSQAYSVLPLVINLGYGVMSFYFIIVSYLYLNLYKHKVALHQEFSRPYYQKTIEFDEPTLILINEELSSPMMEQFVFECVDNDSEYNVINKIEKENAKSFFSERRERKKVEESHLFEPEVDKSSNLPEGSRLIKQGPPSKGKHTILDKYSSFLED